MAFNFTLYLTLLTIFSGLLALVNRWCLSKNRQHSWGIWSWLFDYARAFFPILLIVLLVRSFIIQPYRVPTSSLSPTVMPGDFIAVSQFNYGLRLPVLRTKFLSIGEPQRGDIALFHWPVDPRIIFVKRVIGIPGDHIVYKDKVLTINGVKASQTFIQHTYDDGDGQSDRRLVYRVRENLGHIQHDIFIQPVGGETQAIDLTVPAGQYFMMGDNRDDSDDSRRWGFVPEANLIGRAFGVWFSWDAVNHRVQWKRIGHALH